MADIPHPSGEQVELTHGAQRAVVVEVGGGLRRYAVGEWEVLDGYGADERIADGRGQVLIPWPNRLRDGRYEWGGETWQLALTEPDKRNAIHGLVRWLPWRATERAADRVTMACQLHPQPGWPFTLDVEIEYALTDDGLSVRTRTTNLGGDPCPFGAGAHPYLTVGTARLDDTIVQAPGRLRLLADERQIPTGEQQPVEGTPYDFLAPRPLGEVQLDDAFAALARDADGLARVHLSAPDGSRRATLWMDDAYDHLMLFTGDSLPEPSRRRRSLGVEPMTCAPNALQSGAGLRTLAPGETFAGAWGIAA
ncbi:MAG TPA: aldose 1-epimerase family protein [Conexibacter sp.]|nr:aldose 1-epimerase family protein [Conexibacter sp.]